MTAEAQFVAIQVGAEVLNFCSMDNGCSVSLLKGFFASKHFHRMDGCLAYFSDMLNWEVAEFFKSG